MNLHWNESVPRDARTMNRKKKTGKNCKGKAGVDHVTEIVRNHNFHTSCRWLPDYRRRFEGFDNELRWSCGHSRKCVNCGKYTEYFLDPAQCPDRPAGATNGLTP